MLINSLLQNTNTNPQSTPSVSTTTYFLVDLTNFANNMGVDANTISKYVKSVTLPERKVDTTSIDGQMISVQHTQLKQTFDTFQITFFDDRNFTIRTNLLKYMLTKVFDFNNLVYKSASTYKCDIKVYVVNTFLGGDVTSKINNTDITISTIEDIITNKNNVRTQTTTTPVYVYTFYGQFPTEIPELTFSATDELEPTITVTFTYDWYKIDTTNTDQIQLSQLSLI